MAKNTCCRRTHKAGSQLEPSYRRYRPTIARTDMFIRPFTTCVINLLVFTPFASFTPGPRVKMVFFRYLLSPPPLLRHRLGVPRSPSRNFPGTSRPASPRRTRTAGSITSAFSSLPLHLKWHEAKNDRENAAWLQRTLDHEMMCSISYSHPKKKKNSSIRHLSFSIPHSFLFTHGTNMTRILAFMDRIS